METKNADAAVREYAPEDLETENFRIDSTGWKEKKDRNGVRYLENPEGDVTELLDGPYAGEQHFQNDGAVERELAKAGKRTMTPEEWKSFAERHADWMMKNLSLSGIRKHSSSGTFFKRQGHGYYWAFSVKDKNSARSARMFFVAASSTEVVPNFYTQPNDGLSVICLRKQAS